MYKFLTLIIQGPVSGIRTCRRGWVFTGVFILLLFFHPGEADGQSGRSGATLLGWEQRTLNFMLDRSHNFGGTNYKRDLFRETINQMSPEHEIDLLTYRYTLTDDYDWINAKQAYRLSVGSLNATDFAIENRMKFTRQFNKKNSFLIDGIHEENLRTNRFLFRLAYERHLKGRHHLGIGHTLGNSKSDLDMSLYYRYGTFENGMIQAGFTWLDWGANVVQGLAEESSNEWNERYESTFQYTHSPILLNLKLISPTVKNFRVEVLMGLQTYSEKEVRSTKNVNEQYLDKEWAHYLGGMLQYSHPLGLAGVTYRRRFSKLRREPMPGSEYVENYYTRQYSDSGGLFATLYFNRITIEQWVLMERNVDQLQGDVVPDDLSPDFLENVRRPFDFVEHRWKLKSRLLYGSTRKGVQLGLEFHADYRNPQGEKDPVTGIRNYDFRRVYPVIRDRNDRFTFTVGYRVNRNFYLLGGVSYDLDRDTQSGIGMVRDKGTWFDGGFGRMSLEW